MHSHTLPLDEQPFHHPLQRPPLHHWLEMQTSFSYEYPEASFGIEPCPLKGPFFLYDNDYKPDVDYPFNAMATPPTRRRNCHPCAAAPFPIPAVPAGQVTGAPFPSACGGVSVVPPQAPINYGHHQQQQSHVAVEDNSGYTQNPSKYNYSTQGASTQQQVLQEAHSAGERQSTDTFFGPAMSSSSFGDYHHRPMHGASQDFMSFPPFLEHCIEDDNGPPSAVNQPHQELQLQIELLGGCELINDRIHPAASTKRTHRDALKAEEPPQRRRRLGAQPSTPASSLAKQEGDGREDEEKMVPEEEEEGLAVFSLHPIGSGLVFAGHGTTCQALPRGCTRCGRAPL
ncbi:hypothetical protein QOT17_020895 [Balamuthia mandrillaris]